ncbi:hypothetical protein Pmani_035321 [Petrolisthes manimaculis]|uniref:Uncharacterized protein n=1 Tax=Petrolisthes manimaculis TaxID=1843537 RepID=A0AAE1NN47_9EUCA|nr:hypothetical protein Pmani_035321 [Petrolisthes manimaculis]
MCCPRPCPEEPRQTPRVIQAGQDRGHRDHPMYWQHRVTILAGSCRGLGSSDIMKPAVWMLHSEEKAPTFDCEASATLGSKLYPAWPDCEHDLRCALTPAPVEPGVAWHHLQLLLSHG